MVSRPCLYGISESAYVRIVRLTLAEKGIAYDVIPVDVFENHEARHNHLVRQPFGRIPAFTHGDFNLYETAAITRYIDEAFPGPSLQPTSPRQRARLAQIVGILDSYAYRALVWDLYVETYAESELNRASDPAQIAAALPRVRLCLSALGDLVRLEGGPWLVGLALSLADLHAAPMFDYALKTEDGRRLLADYPVLAAWWMLISTRPNVAELLGPSHAPLYPTR